MEGVFDDIVVVFKYFIIVLLILLAHGVDRNHVLLFLAATERKPIDLIFEMHPLSLDCLGGEGLLRKVGRLSENRLCADRSFLRMARLGLLVFFEVWETFRCSKTVFLSFMNFQTVHPIFQIIYSFQI